MSACYCGEPICTGPGDPNHQGGGMRRIREMRGVRLKNGREWFASAQHTAVMYDCGIQFESDGGATLFEWEEIELVFV